MPEKMERALKAEAKKKGLSKERAGAYIYGTMRKTGWKPSREKRHLPGMSEHAVENMNRVTEIPCYRK